MLQRALVIRKPTVGALGALAAAGAAALLASGAPPAQGLALKASTPACRTSGLVVWLDTQSNGAAGTIFYTLNFTNLSGSTCTLRGYPGVSAVSLSGRQLGQSARRDSSIRVRTITIRNGASASATLGIVETGNFSNSLCGAVTAAGLKVFPPGQATAKAIPFPFSACSRSGASYLKIRVVTT